ncbi:Zn(II)2Cys6 domain-containing transcription factor tpcE [Aspergillus lucknowensis]|uniref:Aflatoxin regulatory protein-domain-containing protein n=1 Tax=Aspergillus lucknowensis TaxID=176173 RepID=A0ABR4M570_9EURO
MNPDIADDADSASPRAPPVVRRSALGCTKLRDSCHSCATSKIKCPKEKPSCSKCEARGIECQYFFARRPGRRRENSTGHPTSCTSNNTTTTTIITNSSTSSSNNSSSSSSASSSSSPSSSSSVSSHPKSVPDKDPPRAPDAIEANPPDPPFPSNSVLDIAPTDHVLGPYSSDLFSVLEDPSVFAPLPDFDSNMTDVDFSTMDYFEQPAIDSDSFTRTLNDIGSLLIPETISFDLSALDTDPLSASAVPSLASSVPTPSTTHSMMMMRAPSADIACRCIAQALDVLKVLSSAKSPPVSPFGGPGAATMSSAQAVMAENQQYIETVGGLLSCSSCTDDPFLLAIVSMIVLKILERYAATARTQVSSVRGAGESDPGQRPASGMIPSGKDQMRPLSRSYNMPRDDSTGARVPARLVLSELHRVQRLVNLLSPKLKRSQEADTRGFEHAAWGRHTVANENDKAHSTPFSPNTLAQMEGDMRKSLSSLSADIINRLRQD